MRLQDVLFAHNAHRGVRRLTILMVAAGLVVWTIVFLNEVYDVFDASLSDWVTYLLISIGIVFVPMIGLSAYFLLPPLGKGRKWEKFLIFLGPLFFWVLFMGIAGSDAPLGGEDVVSLLLVALPTGIILAFVSKLIVWLIEGFQGNGG